MHDRNGNPLKVGDKVAIPATITSTSVGEQKFCNIGVALDVKMGLDDPSAYVMTLSLNAGQVDLIK